MATKKKSTSISASSLYKEKPKKSRKGIHAKTKMSKNKGSKNYVKVSVGQG
jgi:hypothetical protein